MKLLVTHGSQSAADLVHLVAPHFAAYANRHGYRLLAVTKDPPGLDGRSPHWAKIALMRELLPETELLLWVDCDIVLRDQLTDIAEGLHDGDFQALCMEQTAHGLGPNTGLWLVRNNFEARDFLNYVWDRGPLPDAALNDQATVADLLGFSYLPNLTRPIRPSRWLARTGWLHPLWNTLLVAAPELQTVARGLHYGGLTTSEKLALIRQQLINDRLPGWESTLTPELVDSIKQRSWPHPAPLER